MDSKWIVRRIKQNIFGEFNDEARNLARQVFGRIRKSYLWLSGRLFYAHTLVKIIGE